MISLKKKQPKLTDYRLQVNWNENKSNQTKWG